MRIVMFVNYHLCMKEAADKLDAPYYLTSAKANTQVETLFRHVARLLLA
jgi:hypothetical protein